MVKPARARSVASHGLLTVNGAVLALHAARGNVALEAEEEVRHREIVAGIGAAGHAVGGGGVTPPLELAPAITDHAADIGPGPGEALAGVYGGGSGVGV